MAGHLSDGCINLDAYNGAPTKIVHLLKHGVTHQNPDGYKSLVDMIKHNRRKNPDSLPRIWRACAQRAFCIFNNFPRWACVSELDPATELWPAFAETAVVNLCKQTGAATTRSDALATGAARHAPDVARQIDELDPDIVICGGTFAVQMAAMSLSDEQMRTSPSGMRYAEVNDILYLDAYHPSHRLKRPIEYAFFRAGASETCPPYIRRAR